MPLIIRSDSGAPSELRMGFQDAHSIAAVFNAMREKPLSDENELAIVIGRITAIAINSLSAVHTLVLNGFGLDGLRIARSMYEAEVNIRWLKDHPDDVRDYIDFAAIEAKRQLDQIDSKLESHFSIQQRMDIEENYAAVAPRFLDRSGKKVRNEWCNKSIKERAEEGELAALHGISYRFLSSLQHVDQIALLAYFDSEMQIDISPSRKYLEQTLAAAHGSAIRCLLYWNEVAAFEQEAVLESLMNSYSKTLEQCRAAKPNM